MISARVHYASLALVELAVRQPGNQPVTVREISERHGVPGPFLVQILRTLRSAGWVQSVRGSQGGYRLLADPTKLTLLDIADTVGCQESPLETDGGSTGRLLGEVWTAAGEASREVLAQTTLADIAARAAAGSDEVMFYI